MNEAADTPRPATSPDFERTVPYYCPYCGGEDLRPHEASRGGWECRECTRVFSVALIGMVVTGDHAVA
jgi:ribosomal protein L37AE/L43A